MLLDIDGKLGAVVLLDLTNGRWVIRGCEHILNPQDLTYVLVLQRSKLLTIVRQQHARRAIGHNQICYDCFCHTVECGRSERSTTDELRTTVQYNRKVFGVQ